MSLRKNRWHDFNFHAKEKQTGQQTLDLNIVGETKQGMSLQGIKNFERYNKILTEKGVKQNERK